MKIVRNNWHLTWENSNIFQEERKWTKWYLSIYIHNRRRDWHNPRFSGCKSDRTRWRRIEKGAKIGRFILSIYYSLCIVKRYFHGMNTLPRVTKGHHWRPLNALRCPSTRLLTPSSTVFQPIFPPVAYAIRVNGCNHPYPTAYCFLLYSSRPKIVKERKKRYSLRCIRIINEPWKYVTNPRLLSLSTQPTFICLSIGGKLKVGRRE